MPYHGSLETSQANNRGAREHLDEYTRAIDFIVITGHRHQSLMESEAGLVTTQESIARFSFGAPFFVNSVSL